MHVFLGILIFLGVGFFWLQHFLYTWHYDMMLMFLFGLAFPPAGIIHGVLITFGFV